MRVSIHPQWARRAPGLCLGIVHGRGLVHQPSDARLDGLVNALCRDLEQSFSVRTIVDLPQIAATRKLLRAAGTDPTRDRPSNEGLLRRVVQGRGLYRIDTIVDVNNYCSLKWRLPFGIYNHDRLVGALTYRVGDAGETYLGIGGVPARADRRPILSDAEKIVGGPVLDADATKITASTTHILAVCYGPPGILPATVAEATADLAHLLVAINEGETETELITADARGRPDGAETPTAH